MHLKTNKKLKRIERKWARKKRESEKELKINLGEGLCKITRNGKDRESERIKRERERQIKPEGKRKKDHSFQERITF